MVSLIRDIQPPLVAKMAKEGRKSSKSSKVNLAHPLSSPTELLEFPREAWALPVHFLLLHHFHFIATAKGAKYFLLYFAQYMWVCPIKFTGGRIPRITRHTPM